MRFTYSFLGSSSSMHAALIFDCDGTLTDSMPVHFLAGQAVFARHGLHLGEDLFYELAGKPTREVVEHLVRASGVAVDADAVTREKEAWFIDNVHLVAPIEYVLTQARAARGKKKLAVASGGVRRIVQMQLDHIGIGDWFDAIVTADDVARHKPEPDVFLEAARRLGVPPAQCLVYEDGDLGIEAARRAGMDCIDVRQFHTPRRITQSG